MSRATVISLVILIVLAVGGIIAMQTWNPDLVGGSTSSSFSSSAMMQWSSPSMESSSASGSMIEIEQEFENKIVYTMDQSADESALQADCAARGGTFDSCGSPCAPDAEVCIEVCAFTCTMPGA